MDLRLDFPPAGTYTSPRQIARVATESWIERELPCLGCGRHPLARNPANTRAEDFRCLECEEPFELKSRRGHHGSAVVDGAYATLRATVEAGTAPNLLLLGYDPTAGEVSELSVVHRSLWTPLAIVPRRPLPPSARRHGWVGCTIRLDLLPESSLIPIVRGGREEPPGEIRAAWDRYRFLDRSPPEFRGWGADVLACLGRLPNRLFSLSDAYGFERELGALHPQNRNVRPKIRQQLQILERHGLLRRVRPGLYQRV